MCAIPKITPGITSILSHHKQEVHHAGRGSCLQEQSKVRESVMRQKQVEGVYGRQVILVGAHWCKDHFKSKIFGGQLI